jgi:HK97 gp10 family phage protein
MADFEVQGLKELNEKLQQLPAKLEKNILRGAIRSGAMVIVEDARRRAPVLSVLDPRRVFGALAKSIRAMGVQMRNGMLTGGVVAGGTATVGRGKAKLEADAFYARFVEFGTAKMAARPFMRPAIDSKTTGAIDATAQYIRERADNELLS